MNAYVKHKLPLLKTGSNTMPSKIGNMQIKIMDVKGKTINRIPNACV